MNPKTRPPVPPQRRPGSPKPQPAVPQMAVQPGEALPGRGVPGSGVPSPSAPVAAFERGHILHTWRTLNAHLETLTEEQAWNLLEQERSGPARVQLILRLYGRANKLRAQRERKAVLGG